jgi:hypothetical protein
MTKKPVSFENLDILQVMDSDDRKRIEAIEDFIDIIIKEAADCLGMGSRPGGNVDTPNPLKDPKAGARGKKLKPKYPSKE